MNINTTYTKIITGEDLRRQLSTEALSILSSFIMKICPFSISTVSNGTGILNWSLFILNPEPLLCGLEKTNFI